MTTPRLIQAAQAAAELFRDGDTPDQHEIRELVRAVDAYKADDLSGHQHGCLMCAVRALTEGVPATLWTPTEPGQKISGVVLRMGEFETVYGWVPFVDLWTGGTGRVRINAYPNGLRGALTSAAAQVGDTLTIQFDGMRPLEPSKMGRFPFREVKTYSANVQRGH